MKEKIEQIRVWTKSLTGQLIMGLGAQSFVGFFLIGLIVMIFVNVSLETQQEKSLEDKYKVVMRVLSANPEKSMSKKVFEQFDAFFFGQTDLVIRLKDMNDQVVYQSVPNAMIPKYNKLKSFQIEAGVIDKKPLKAQIWIDTQKEWELILKFFWFLSSLALLGSMLVILYLSRWVKRSLNPLLVLTEKVSLMAKSLNLEQLSEVNLPSELINLQQAFNKLVQQLNHSQKNLKQFNADLAHELFNPLATLRTSLEVSLTQKNLSDEVALVLEENLIQVGHLISIVNDLLFLAKAENQKEVVLKLPLDINQWVNKVIDYYQLLAEEKGIVIKLSQEEIGTVLGDERLLKRALSNLIQNALRYGAQGSTLEINIQKTTEAIVFSVINVGPPIDPKHMPFLFERFYRVNQDRSEHQDARFGLGLSLVKAIALIHNGQVSVENLSEEKVKFSFSIQRPTSA